VLPRQVHGVHHHHEDEGEEHPSPLVSTLLILNLVTAQGGGCGTLGIELPSQKGLVLLLMVIDTITQILHH
jgi:hypothetical protein